MHADCRSYWLLHRRRRSAKRRDGSVSLKRHPRLLTTPEELARVAQQAAEAQRRVLVVHAAVQGLHAADAGLCSFASESAGLYAKAAEALMHEIVHGATSLDSLENSTASPASAR